jgi:hypothetical protein
VAFWDVVAKDDCQIVGSKIEPVSFSTVGNQDQFHLRLSIAQQNNYIRVFQEIGFETTKDRGKLRSSIALALGKLLDDD